MNDGTMTTPVQGPHPGVLAAISLGLLAASLVTMSSLSGGETIVSPFEDTETVSGFFADHGFAASLGSMLQLGSSIPLGIYAASVYARQLRLGVRVPGPVIGLFGGAAAAVLLMVSAVVTWTQSQMIVSADPELTHALAYISFAAGGFAHVVGLGLLVAGIAVPSMILRLMPMWFTWVGLALAVAAELSILSMVFEPLQYLIPIGRFGSLIWLIAAGFLLPKFRESAKGCT